MVGKFLCCSRLAVMTLQIDTNVDDMDPRLWPEVLDRLLSAGALDAWITPIIMKKGRPAHMLSALCEPDDAAAVRLTIFQETTTIGLREHRVDRHVLDRTITTVNVDGHPIAVKVASLDGTIMNRSVEWDDVVAAGHALGRPAKQVLADATALAATLMRDD